ncbi:NAD(P)-binding protein [Auricularia subglabra TFB-10046 SS5]|uniref:NAD(P)-binding protein n=1 Tax=Auricularia subglabra (strain TFB-10046 / SS5) TaxID=717982 RepID=J0LIB1_AURST|nr:NAD(P)-binding protein [Auricularia subglabra TFB-10046 SS5]
MGVFGEFFFVPKATWTAADVPDLAGRVFVVTGGASGIGRETVKELLRHNGRVYIAARNRERAQAVADELVKEVGRAPEVLVVDLASLASVRDAANEFNAKEQTLDALINCGGAAGESNATTAEGYDLLFGTNVLGHYYLTHLLLPALKRNLEAHGRKGRVTSVSSIAHTSHAHIDYETLVPGDARDRKKALDRYGQSKFGNVVFAFELARREGAHIVSSALNPGTIHTPMYDANKPGVLASFLMESVMYEVDHGAITPLWAATALEAENVNGQYLVPWARVGQAAKEGYDPEVGKKLWTWLEECVRKFESQ